MKKRTVRGMIIMLVAALVLTMMPLTASAASGKPGKVKGVTVSVGKVNAKKNTATVTVKWKAVSGATGYEVWGKHESDGKWKKLKKVGRFTKGLKIKKTSPGKVSFKVRALKKKKKGSFSGVKTKFIKSKWNLEKCINANGGKAEFKKANQDLASIGASMSVSGNSWNYTFDLDKMLESENPNIREINFTPDDISAIKNGFANNTEMKKLGADLVKLAKNGTGVKAPQVVFKFTHNGSQIFSLTYK